jgi:hypothetical protein
MSATNYGNTMNDDQLVSFRSVVGPIISLIVHVIGVKSK